ncbi:MAG: hypothetical protein HQL54_00880 [Magnetococcales bacterium]|nr:hypothetical protein [Magnetococcales bacterium]
MTKPHSSRPSRPRREYKQGPKKNALIGLKAGDFFEGDVKIVRKVKPGPVIFQISDGSGNFDAVTRDSDYKAGDVVRLSGDVNARAGRMQIEIRNITPSELDFDTIVEQKSQPVRTDFSISSDRLDKMRTVMVRIAARIRKAIFNNQPVLIRHHNDSDGINSGIAMESAIRMLMVKIGIKPEYALYRSPSKAPFYEVADVFRDIVQAKRFENFDQGSPLILILDNGSTPEDVFGMKTMHAMGKDVIVIDHHNPVQLENGKTSVCPYLLDHVNPYMFGLDSQTCAGMLSYEIARFICEDFENKLIPAVAGISDRCRIPETDAYIERTGKSREELGKIGIAIDFTAYHMRHQPGKGLFEELYTNEQLVTSINELVKEGEDTQLQSTLPYLRTQKIKGVTLAHIDLEKYTLRFTYPNPGRVIGLIHDTVTRENDNQPVLSLGCLSDMVIVRANQPILPVQTIIDRLQKALPEANVDGGGHEMAGAIKFVSAHFSAVMEQIKGFLNEREIEVEAETEY